MVCPTDSSILLPCSFCHDTTLQHYPRYSTTVSKALRQTLRVSFSERRTDLPKFTYEGDKRCMLMFLKLVVDFWRRCAGRRIGHLLFATHHTATRELTHASLTPAAHHFEGW
jgi:hypothetical protein